MWWRNQDEHRVTGPDTRRWENDVVLDDDPAARSDEDQDAPEETCCTGGAPAH